MGWWKAKMQMGEGGREEVSSSKKKDQSAKMDTLFMTKMAAKWLKSVPNLKPYSVPFGAAHTYVAHIREYTPPPGF